MKLISQYIKTIIPCCIFFTLLYLGAQQTTPQQPIIPSYYEVQVINDTDWEVHIGYTSPQGTPVIDSIPRNTTKTIVAKDIVVKFSLAKEQGKIRTGEQFIPAADIQKKVYQINAGVIKDLIPKDTIDVKK